MELGEVYVKIGADIVPLEKALGKARGVTKKTTEQMRAQMKTIGTGMVIAGAAITAAFALTVKSAISFQKQLAQVSTMLDESAMKIMPQYKKGLLDMSMAFGESTDTLSRGLYDILSASIPPAKALEVLGVAAKAATAGITDTGVAADAITTILNSYGMVAEDAGKVSDILFATVKRGKLTFDELAPAIGKSAALAATAGLSFEDLTAMIATLTRAGIRVDEAMTSVNGVLRAFLKPTDDAKEAAKEFGLTLDTNTLKTIGMTGVMEKLKDATAEQLAVIFPNIRALKGMAALLGDMEGYTEDYALMLNSAGLTQEAFAKQSATLGFKIDQLKKSFNVIAVTVGDVLIPIIQNIVEGVGKLVFGMKEWMDAHPGLTKVIVLLGAALGVFTMAGGLLILGALYFTKLNETMRTVMGTSKAMIPSIAKLRVSINTLNGAILVASANIIIWSEVWRTWQEIAWDSITTANDVAKAWDNTAKYQEETAKKLGITVEQYKEYLEAGLSVSDMLKRAPADYEAYNLGMAELTQRAKEGKISASELYIAMQDLARETGVLTEKTIEEEVAAKTIVTTVKDLTQEMSLLTKEYGASSQAISENITYYTSMIDLLNRTDVILQTELMLLEKGTEEWYKKKEEIADNTKALNEINEALAKLVEPLEGLELIAAKMAMLGDSTEDTKEKIELLNEQAVLLQQALDEAIPDTEAWWEAKIAFEENQTAIEGLKNKLKELTEEEKEAIRQAELLADAYKSITDKIYELTHTPMETAIYKLDQQKEEYLKLGVAIGKVNEWYGLQIAKLNELNPKLDETTEKLKKTSETVRTSSITTDQLNEAFGGVVKTITLATATLSNFTKEGVAASIAAIKMSFLPALIDIREIMAAVKRSFFEGMLSARDYTALQIFYQRQINDLLKEQKERIDIVLYGWKEYQNILAGMEAGGGGTVGFQFGTPYVPKTGLYKLHEGERVTPANQNTYNNTFSPILNMSVQGGGSPNRIAQEVERVLYDTGRQFKRRGFEMVPGRG